MDNKQTFQQRLLPRFAASLAGSALGVLLAALLDTLVARQSNPGAGFGALFSAELGLLGPLGLLLGGAAAAFAVLLLPPRFPRQLDYGAPAAAASNELCLRWLSWPLLAALGTLLSGRLTLKLLASPAAAGSSGAAAALIALLVAISTAAVALGLSRALAERWSPPFRERTAAVIGLSAGALVLGLAIASGTTSGSGGALALFGVFKRPELDLKGPGLLLLVLCAGLLVPPLERRSAQLVALALPFLLLPLTARAANGAFEDRSVALTVERAAPLGKPLLGLARRLSDSDRDRFAARFGGGDCAEGDPAVNPEAVDVPGNGRDEDCSGTDAQKIELAAAPLPAAAASELGKRLPARPNVVLISIDTLRHDIGYAGYERKITPEIDVLARKSVVFDKAYALASYTSKSLAPLLIGKYGLETQRGWSHFNRFPKDVFLAERLQKSGIRTISVQGYWYFVKGYGLERGFDVVDSSASPKTPQLEGDRSFTADKLSDAAIAQLGNPELDDKQFFLWVHYTDPHSEYVLHEGFDFGKKSRDLYDSEVAFVDHHVGRVLRALQAEPFAERTLIVLTSDHGEAFGEHGMIRHGFELWEELVRVPLLFYVPGLAPAHVSERRSAIDLVPTLLDVFRVEPPPSSAPDSLSGSSLLSDVLRPAGYEPKPRVIFIDMQAGPHNAERQAFIENDLKLVMSAGRPLGLYDLGADPGEKQDLLDQQADRAKTLLERAKAFKATLKEVRVRPE